MKEHTITTIRDLLHEGKALDITDEMRETADNIARSFTSIFIDMGNAYVQHSNEAVAQNLSKRTYTGLNIRGKLKNVLTKGTFSLGLYHQMANILNDNAGGEFLFNTPHGPRRVVITWGIPLRGGMMGGAGHVSLTRNVKPKKLLHRILKYVSIKIQTKAFGDKWFITLMLPPSLIKVFWDQWNKDSAFTVQKQIPTMLRDILYHELTHVLDPKMQPGFTADQRMWRSRKGYDPLAGQPEPNEPRTDQVMSRYYGTPAEQETWPRDIARYIIRKAVQYAQEELGAATVDEVIEEVEFIARAPLPHASSWKATSQYEMALHHGLLTLSSNPSKWRRVLTTLSAELEKFKSNPHYYSDPVFYNPPEV